MRDRAAPWLAAAQRQSEVAEVKSAPRPSPRPPVEARPTELPVTSIVKLIRDPYEIYARLILNLRKLDPLSPEPDVRMRGTITHKIMEAFLKLGVPPDDPAARDRLLHTAEQILASECPWPATRHMWMARLAAVADWFLTTEVTRQTRATPTKFESKGEATLDTLGFTLTAKADRIDLTDTGEAVIYDYKTGAPPTKKQQLIFEKQLLLEAAMIAHGIFDGIATKTVNGAAYIGLGSDPKEVPAPINEKPPDETWEEFHKLIAAWQDRGQGYTAKMALEKTSYEGDYDHLSRLGEWDTSSEPEPGDVG